MRRAFLTRTVLLLGFVSLFTDIASEMLYPVLPMYLGSIGFSAALIGVLEGVAEAVAGASKGFFGRLSDRTGRRAVFIRAGYFLSAISKPIMALAAWPWAVFGARTLDRLGKGVRTAPRDAMLAAEAAAGSKGRVFGFHRALDTAGAAIGPAGAVAFLAFYPARYAPLFLLAAVPGLVSCALTLLVHDRPHEPRAQEPHRGPFAFLGYWRKAPREYRVLAAGLLFFALVNSSDVLLLLLMRHNGASDGLVIGIYMFYNLIYALLSYPMGALGDRIGLKATFIAGLFLFACVYGLIGSARSPVALGGLLSLYGAFAAATEGISKAWISDIVPEAETASAIGLYAGLQSVLALLASSIAGLLWVVFSPVVPFMVSSAGALLAGGYLAAAPVRGRPRAAPPL